MSRSVIAIGAFPEERRALLADAFDARFIPDADALGGLPEALRREARAVALSGQKAFGAAAMELLPSLGIVAGFGVGYDAIDVVSARARGIAVTNTPDVLTDDVADFAVAMALALFREIVAGEAWARSGAWAAQGPMPLNRRLSGRPAGIMGLGRIGRAVAERLAAFRMPIHYWNRSPRETPGWTAHTSPESLAGAVDLLVVALPGGPATKGAVSASVLEALGPEGVLVNIARGETVDEAALLDALEQGRIRGAALDVFLNEPDIDPRFARLTNVLLQPHQASATRETRAAMAGLQKRNLDAFFAGETLISPV